MKARRLVTVLLKLMGLYVFMQFLLMLPSTIGGLMTMRSMSASTSDGIGPALATLFVRLLCVSLVWLAFSVGLFVAAPRLSRFFVEDQDEEVSLSGDVSDGIQAWSFRCFGLYALITWCPGLVQTLCRTIVYGTWESAPVSLRLRFYEHWSLLISPAAGVILGLLLLFKAKGLVRLIQLSRPMSRARAEYERGGDQPASDGAGGEAGGDGAARCDAGVSVDAAAGDVTK